MLLCQTLVCMFFKFKKTHRPLKPHKTSFCDAICSIFNVEVKVVYEACVRGALKHCHESCESVSKAWTVKTNISILAPILTKPHEKLLFWWEFLVEGRSEWDTTVPLAGKASDYQITNVTAYKFTVADSRLRYIGPTNQTNSFVTDVCDMKSGSKLLSLSPFLSLFPLYVPLTNTYVQISVHTSTLTHAHTPICIATQQAYCLFHHFLAMLFTYLIAAVLSFSEKTNRSISFHWKWNYYAAATLRSVLTLWNLLCNCLS